MTRTIVFESFSSVAGVDPLNALIIIFRGRRDQEIYLALQNGLSRRRRASTTRKQRKRVHFRISLIFALARELFPRARQLLRFTIIYRRSGVDPSKVIIRIVRCLLSRGNKEIPRGRVDSTFERTVQSRVFYFRRSILRDGFTRPTIRVGTARC